MKYCIDYNKESSILDKIDEINIEYKRIESDEALQAFCEEHKNQRINVCINDYEEGINEGYFKNSLDFQKNHPNINNLYLRFPGKGQELDMMLSNDYPDAKFYFDIKVNDWDKFIGLIEYNVTDIYIIEGMGFELDKISKIAKAHNTQIRVYPNVAQSSWNSTDDLRKFWIRPEDIGFYDDYIDVCEFFGDKEKFDILYNIYKKDKKWFGNLNEIIIGLKEHIDSRYIVPRFVKKRVRCGRECMKGGNCQMCDRIKELSSNLEKAGLMITMEEEKSNIEEENNNG